MRWGWIKINKFLKLFVALEVWMLVLFILLAWAVACVGYGIRNHFGSDVFVRSFAALFDVAKATTVRASGGVPDYIVALLKVIGYFFVWLLGGGVLISAIVGQYNKIRDCEFRLWKWVIGKYNHVIIFGWNSAVLSFLKQEVENGHLIIIMTTSDPRIIRTELDDIIGSRKDQFIIYRCCYDDASEREKNLNLKSVKLTGAYVAGEGQSSLNDARSLRLAESLRGSVANECKVYCNIHDFGLAKKLVKETDLNVNIVNFHSEWGERIGNALAGKINEAVVHLVGFGAMGKAIAIKLLDLDFRSKIMISSENNEKLKFEYDRFEKEFSEYQRRVEMEDLDKFKNMLQSGESNVTEKKIVIVAMREAQKGLLVLMDLVSGKKGIEYYLSQEIDGFGQETGLPEITLLGNKVTLFGMNRGAKWNPEEKKA